MTITIFSCKDKENNNSSNCDQQVIISADEYANATSDGLFAPNIIFEGNCLSVTIGGSGCDGSTWILNLIDSEGVMESNPPQRNLKLSFENNEACLAVFERTFSFDIENLQVDGQQVLLNIEGLAEPILYEY